MLRNTVLVGLLTLPGAFFVLGLACLHPQLRKEIVRRSGLSSPLTKTGRAYTGTRARLPLHPGHPGGASRSLRNLMGTRNP